MATQKEKRTRRSIPPEAREKATRTRQQRSIFNRYLSSMRGKRISATREKIREIEAILERGTKERKVPKFVDGKRAGTEVKEVPLLPADKARLLKKRKELLKSLPTTGKESLRKQFLEILPDYARSQGWDREILLEVGVPEADLDEAGIE